MFRARFRGSEFNRLAKAPSMCGVLIFGVDDRKKVGATFDVTKVRFLFKADNGAERTYLGGFLGSSERKLIMDELGDFIGKTDSNIMFSLPNGEEHVYDLLRELEVTEGTTRVEVVAASMCSTPKATSHG